MSGLTLYTSKDHSLSEHITQHIMVHTAEWKVSELSCPFQTFQHFLCSCLNFICSTAVAIQSCWLCRSERWSSVLDGLFEGVSFRPTSVFQLARNREIVVLSGSGKQLKVVSYSQFSHQPFRTHALFLVEFWTGYPIDWLRDSFVKLPVVKSDVNCVRPVQGSVEPYSVEPYTATWPQKVGDWESATPENGVDDCRWTSQEKDYSNDPARVHKGSSFPLLHTCSIFFIYMMAEHPWFH